MAVARSFTRLSSFAVLLAGISVLAGCTTSSFFSKQSIATVSGSAIGNAADSTKTGESGNVAVSPGDALAGGIIGNKLGTKLNEGDQKIALNAEFEALEYTPAGKETVWRSNNSGNYGVVIAEETYDVGSKNCRQYTHTIYSKGQSNAARGTACKEQDGTWVPLG